MKSRTLCTVLKVKILCQFANWILLSLSLSLSLSPSPRGRKCSCFLLSAVFNGGFEILSCWTAVNIEQGVHVTPRFTANATQIRDCIWNSSVCLQHHPFFYFLSYTFFLLD
jgi:hypothetical protein